MFFVSHAKGLLMSQFGITKLGLFTRQTLKLIERSVFVRNHPEMSPHIGSLINTVICCKKFGGKLLDLRLEEAHTHTQTCTWCMRALKTEKELDRAQFEANRRK